jgi:PTS system mannose-specific IIB component
VSWALVRLDDRLLHGQVAVGWAGRLHPARIVIADDRLSATGWERDLVMASGPEGVPVDVLAVDELPARAAALAERAFLLLRSPAELARLLGAGLAFPEVNLGGLHSAEGKKRVLDYLYLTPAEAAALRAAAAAGTRLVAQDVPGNPAQELLPLLPKAGL